MELEFQRQHQQQRTKSIAHLFQRRHFHRHHRDQQPGLDAGRLRSGHQHLHSHRQYTASPTNGYAPLTVQFNCAGLDSSNNVIARWHWNFGDNTTASTNQSPAHVYGSVGGYAPIVIVTNNLGFTIYASGPAMSVVPAPSIKGSTLSKTNLFITGTNGIAGLTNYVLMSTNLTLPRSQWKPVAMRTSGAPTGASPSPSPTQ